MNQEQLPTNQPPIADDEITLKDIILKLQDWWSIVWPKKNLIIAGALGVGLFAALFTKFTAQRQYTASHQIIFKGESSGGMSSALRLASSLGFGGVGGSGGGAAGTVAFYITSNENIERALLLEEGPGKLIDLYIQPFLEDDEEFAADYNAKFLQDQRFTDSVLSVVRYYILEENVSAVLDEESGILSLSVTSPSEQFSFELARRIVRNTEQEFVDQSKEENRSVVNAFQIKTDSIKAVIDQLLLEGATFQDQNQSLISSVDRIKQIQISIAFESAKVAYAEYIKGLEMSRADGMNIKPPFEVYDSAKYPLPYEKPSAAKAGIFGSVITGFLLVLFFIGRVEAKSIMAD
jgi:uncharacterized protein involved in exopolysaccharide biosynthesis